MVSKHEKAMENLSVRILKRAQTFYCQKRKVNPITPEKVTEDKSKEAPVSITHEYSSSCFI
jgi:hypothetical protein